MLSSLRQQLPPNLLQAIKPAMVSLTSLALRIRTASSFSLLWVPRPHHPVVVDFHYRGACFSPSEMCRLFDLESLVIINRSASSSRSSSRLLLCRQSPCHCDYPAPEASPIRG